jgi:hypothetical protein
MGNIVWLASYPKSGNTWLRAFLANLVADAGRPVALDELSGYCDDESRPELFSALAGRPSTELSLEQLCSLRSRVHARIAGQAPGTVLVKTHNFAGEYEGHPLQNLSVTAGAVYIVRNPLDVVMSMSSHFGLGIDESVERICNDQVATGNDRLFVSQVLGSWSTHVSSWTHLPIKRLLVLRYEDLLHEPVAQFARVARLVGMGDDPSRIERAVRFATFDVLSGMEQADGFVEASQHSARFFRAGTAGQWRDVLGPDQVERIVTAHRVQMARFGYLPAGH